MKKKDNLKITPTQIVELHNNAQNRDMRMDQYSGNLSQGVRATTKSQQQNYEQMQQNSQQSVGNQGGVAYVKQIAQKGATGRKGSLPLNYVQVPGQPIQQPSQNQILYRNCNQHRSSQPNFQNQHIEPQIHQQIGNGKGINKHVKSHAKYFSQQNSPIGADQKNIFHHQPSVGGMQTVISQSGAGVIGNEGYPNINHGGLQSQHSVQMPMMGFGTLNPQMNSLPTESRHIKHNSSQLSQQSHTSNTRDLKHLHYMQQLLNNENQAMNIPPPIQSKMTGLQAPTHMKQVHSLGGPVLSQFAGNQTIQSNGSHSNQTQLTTQTFNASINKHAKTKHQYDETYLNGPINQTNSKAQEDARQFEKHRALNNQSQQVNNQFEIQSQQIYGHHKRVVSSQMAQQPLEKEFARSSTATGQYPTNKDVNLSTKQYALKQTKFSQPQIQLEKSQELFQKSGQYFMNTNSIVINSNNDRMAMKQLKSKVKAQTRPNSNQKNQHHQNSGSFNNNQSDFNNTNQLKKPKTSGDPHSAQIDRKQKMRYIEATSQQKRGSLNNTQKNQFYVKDQNLIIGAQNLVYYRAGSAMNSPNEIHISQSNMPVLNNKQSSVVTVPQTMLHKSNKMMNSYLKQSTIQTPGEPILKEANVFNKRMSTDQIQQQEALGLKKQSFHQRAETQLTNPNGKNGLMMFGHDAVGQQQQLQQSNYQNQSSYQNMINTQVQFQNPNKYSIVLNPNVKFNNAKSQKSSTSRLANQQQQTSNQFREQKNANYLVGSNQIQNSADRIVASQRSDQVEQMEQNNSENSGQVITNPSSKHLLNNNPQKPNSQGQYPYQSTSTKSQVVNQAKQAQQQAQQPTSLSIAQIFQQKGLSYKGPSKLVINSSNIMNQQSKLANRMGPNGIIVHTKGGKGSLTTSANTAHNSPKSMVKQYAMNHLNSNNTNNSIRKKPSTASIPSMGPQPYNAPAHQKSLSNKFVQPPVTVVQTSITSSNLRTTSNGQLFKKVQHAKTGANSRAESPNMFQEDLEMAHFNKHEIPNKQQVMLEENSMILHQQQSQHRQRSGKNVVQSQPTNQSKKQLFIGTQPSAQYIADNGGTGSNPNEKTGLHQRHISQQDFYSQNHQIVNSAQTQKKNQHSNSLGNMQQMEMLRAKQSASAIMSGPHPTPQMDIREVANVHLDEFDQQIQAMNEDFDIQGPIITEEEEKEIRQVASDINEQAFYGKILKAKQIITTKDYDSQLAKLSPRSQEIAQVMKEVHQSFKKSGYPPETNINFYRIGKMLGRGAFGKVNLAMHKLVRKLVALKSLNKECLTDEVQKHKLMKEVNLLLRMRNDNVVKIYETIETQKHIIIVMELCAGGDLLNYVRKRRRLKEPYAKKIFKQIIEGLNYIHSKYVAHRDIKLDNILLDGKGQVKIADFGVSKQCTPGQKMREQCGTPAYIAPEILKNSTGYSYNVDLWSAGVVLFAMLYGTVPFKAASMEELHSLILRGMYLLKDDISQEARNMLRGLLEINPHKRLTIPEILSHPWLKDCDDSLQLFNDQEREMIKKEYTYNDPSRFNRNENEEPVDCFTEHHIDSVYNTLKNVSEKSIILAPFNSTQSEDFEQFKKKIKPMMFDKQLVLRLSRLCREVDRQYEFNNNGQLDNGVYHKQINNSEANEEDGKDKKGKKKKDESDEDDESKFQVVQCTKTMGMEFHTEDYSDIKMKDKNGRKQSRMEELLPMQSTFNTREMIIEQDKVNKLVQFGYPYEFVIENLQENLPNYLTAGYYLLQMDQNYC